MNADDVHAVLCPCCNKVLYSGTMNADGVINRSRMEPPIEDDGNGGHFMKCAHCNKHVIMIVIPGGPSGAAYDVAPRQPCT